MDPLTLDLDRKLLRNPALMKLMGQSVVATSDTTLQVQQFAIGSHNDSQKKVLRDTFMEFRNAIYQRWFEHRIAASTFGWSDGRGLQ